ncbi:MAG: YdcF family protein [Anaerolineales bacterium]
MEPVVEVAKNYLLPGSPMFLMVAVTLGLVFLYWHRDAQRWGRFILTGVAAAYWLLSMPAFARMLERGLDPGFGSLTSAEDAEGAQAIVVLAGGSHTYRSAAGDVFSLSRETAARALEASRLYRLLGNPEVIASGGEQEPESGLAESQALSHSLHDTGVPIEQILEESKAASTREQALEMVPFLAEHGIDRFVLVTSAEHMNRALGAFRKAGLDPIPSAPRAGDVEEGTARSAWLPQESGLNQSRTALREYLALLYYWARGWLEVPSVPSAAP